MTFLPIVERELRVVARRPGTYWMRLAAAACVIGVWVALMVSSRGLHSSALGKNIFLAFGVIALGFCLVTGIFLTADCLSEEKREGTLGLLFLTDLRGYDVVLGKLFGTSVRSANGLMAILPILGLPLLMGGVTRGEFWRVALALLTTLFFSLSLGMFISSLNREARQAMAGTFLCLLILSGLLPAISWLGVVLRVTWPRILTLLPSPVYLFISAFDNHYRSPTGRQEFWISFAIVLSLGLIFLTLAALLLPKIWQEGKTGLESSGTGERTSLRFAANTARWVAAACRGLFFLAFRRGAVLFVCGLLLLTFVTLLFSSNLFPWLQVRMLLFFSLILSLGYLATVIAVGGINAGLSSYERKEALERNPFFWLASRDKRSKALVWKIVSLLSVLWACFFIVAITWKRPPPFFLSLLTVYALHQVFKVMVVLEATRQLSEARRNGGLELLLISPLEEPKIIEGQAQALKEHFARVRRFILGINLCMGGLILFVNPLSMGTRDQAVFLELCVGGILMLLLDFKALGSVGTLMSLKYPRPNRAALATFLRVMGIPWAAIFMIVFLGMSGALNGTEPGPVFTIWFGLGIVTDLVVSAKARAMLSRGIRECLELKPPVLPKLTGIQL